VQYSPHNASGSFYDVVIVGGGPAGAAAAALIATEGRKVLVLEKSHFPREKLCGEFISPECIAIFERLGVTEAVRKAGAMSIERMDLIVPGGKRVSIPASWFPGGVTGALGLTRARLDAILLSNASQSGAEVIEGLAASSFERSRHGFVVTAMDHESRTHRFFGKLLIDASGRGMTFFSNANFRKPSRSGQRWFATKVHLRGVTDLSSTGELYFFDQGYGGLTPVEPDSGGSRFNLCFLTTEARFKDASGDRTRLLESTLMTNPIARQRLAHAVPCDEWLGTGPIIYGSQVPPDGVIAIGDAGAFIDPFTGSGILLALTSAEVLASAIALECGSGEFETGAVFDRYRNLFRDATRWRFGATAFLRRLALSGVARRLVAPVLASQSRLTRLLTRATRQGGASVVHSDKRMT
jgi:menaquinone-9 beta-reductase